MVFIPRVLETTNYYFFFGHEVTPSLTYINSLTREVPQSFMLRVCKNDTGFKYTAEEDLEEIRKWRNLSNTEGQYTMGPKEDGLNFTLDQFYFSYSSAAYDDTYRVPTRHFVSAQKFPFGCYLKRYDGAQSLNRFWGEQNIVYFNRLGRQIVCLFGCISSVCQERDDYLLLQLTSSTRMTGSTNALRRSSREPMACLTCSLTIGYSPNLGCRGRKTTTRMRACGTL